MDVKLALLLQQCGNLLEAQAILKKAAAAAANARSDESFLLHGSADERYRHICASRSHRDKALADAVEKMPPASQVLAALHHDATMLLFGIELEIGILEQTEHSQRAVARNVAALQKRKQQVCASAYMVQGKSTAPKSFLFVQFHRQ